MSDASWCSGIIAWKSEIRAPANYSPHDKSKRRLRDARRQTRRGFSKLQIARDRDSRARSRPRAGNKVENGSPRNGPHGDPLQVVEKSSRNQQNDTGQNAGGTTYKDILGFTERNRRTRETRFYSPMITREGKVGKQEGRKGGRKLECRQVRMQDARDSREEATALARTSERSSPALAATPIGAELERASVSPRTRAVHSLCAETKIRLNRSTNRSTGRGVQVEMQAERRGRRETCTR